ncbi:MAG: bifunctional aldolase/short-chain dehydrogenase, partial [bacterium]|nr:bifunctional aldolase/short-chain dehydrogenase [bacterium]
MEEPPPACGKGWRMISRYDEREAARFVKRYSDHGEALALRVYTSRLAGADPALVLHGGGNTSVKERVRDVVVGETEALYVKGSGWDLAAIEPAGFAAIRLAHLRAMLDCAHLSDDEMVNQQRTHLLDYRSPNPSVEALLHALLPQRYVDHTHADAILTLTDQPDGVERALALFGPQALVLEYCMPGFVLAKRVQQRLRDRPAPAVIVLAKHGIFTAGESARDSYERMIAAVDAAEREIARGRAISLTAAAPRPRDPQRRRRFALTLRGALAARGMNAIIAWCEGEAVDALADREGVEDLAARGPITPDHVLRTKPWPVLMDGASSDLRAGVDAALDAYAERYRRYVADGIAACGQRIALDALPRVAIVPGVGICAWGAGKRDAVAAKEIAEHTARVALLAEAIGRYDPVTPPELFALEYWSLEQAKLAASVAAPRDLDGRIAVITGAAGTIGLATAQAFLQAGAHVALTDRNEAALAAARESLREHGARVASLLCDLTESDAGARLVAHACDAFGGLDIVVSNAGIALQGLLHSDDGEAALAHSLEVNFFAQQRVARAAFEAFVTQGSGGALLFNLSKQTFAQSPGFGPYGIAKTAALALMRQYALDGARYAIRANGVNADRVRGGLFTPELAAARAAAYGLSVDEYFAANPLHREVSAGD